MVQLLLARTRIYVLFALAGVLVLPAVCAPAPRAKSSDAGRELWQMSLDGGRSLTWQRSFQSESEVRQSRGFWNKLVDIVAGEPEFHSLIRPYSIATDSHGRVIISDPGAAGVHIFDFEQHKYKFLERRDKRKNSLLRPQCVAVDAEDKIYITDSDAGVIFVYEPSGKFLRALGSLKGGEGYFKRPTGIAVDSAAQRIYVTDTLRDQVFVLDMQGNVLSKFGENGAGPGEFNYPTELRLDGKHLMVVDAMNFRVQTFTLDGKFENTVGSIGDSTGAMFRPKAISIDSEGHIYVVDGLWGVVQVFNREGQLLYYFGAEGQHAGEFQLPTGVSIDRSDHVFVVDSFNRRVQVFQYLAMKSPAGEGQK